MPDPGQNFPSPDSLPTEPPPLPPTLPATHIYSETLRITLEKTAAGYDLSLRFLKRKSDETLGTLELSSCPEPYALAIADILTTARSLHADTPEKRFQEINSCFALAEVLNQARENGASFRSSFGSSPTEALCMLCDTLSSDLTIADFLKVLSCERIHDGIYLMSSPYPYVTNSTFLRFQDYCESIEFKGKVFTLEEYAAWYRSQNEDDGFSYYFHWGGFNVPGEALQPFLAGAFDPLSPRESAFLSFFENLSGKFCVIGADKDDRETIEHEIAHALYYLNQNYRWEIEQTLKDCDISPITEWLEKKGGYHPCRFIDEAHAYLNERLEFVKENGFDTAELLIARKQIREIFVRYAPPEFVTDHA